jgi:hypothetical protein
VLIFVVVASCALLTAVLALALVRENRLRRALEALLTKLLNSWKRIHDSDHCYHANEPDAPRTDSSGRDQL